MKKTLIISIGAFILFLVLGAWIYLLFFGAPDGEGDIFADLGIGGGTTAPAPIVDTPSSDTSPTLPTDTSVRSALRQLTTSAVAGFSFVGSSTDNIRYVDRGTGHIFSLDLVTGDEERISGTTIPQVVEAVFSPFGGSVALVSENSQVGQIFVGKISSEVENIDFITLPLGSSEPGFIDENEIRYLVSTDDGSDGYSLDIRADVPNPLFSIPLRDLSMIWGETTYAYNKPALVLPGALYEINTGLLPITSQAFMLVAGVSQEQYVVSERNEEQFVSYVLNQTTGERSPLSVSYVPEKCSQSTTVVNTLWCASPFEFFSTENLADWYKGVFTAEDALWEIDLVSGSAILTSNFSSTAGRTIDVDKMNSAYDGSMPLFRNKLDGTLWLYDTTLE